MGKVNNLLINVKEMPMVQEVEITLKMEMQLGFITKAW